MSFLSQSLQEYLTLRRSLGYKLVREGMWLPGLVRFVEKAGSSHITSALAVSWAMGRKNPPPPSWSGRLRMARKFTQYLHALDPRTEIPLPELAPPERRSRFEPYIYRDDDVIALMGAARKICTPFKGETYSTMIGLLAATGMRAGEVIRLDRADFDARQGLLQIRHTKFGKSRLVPLHTSTTQALQEYARKRDRAILLPASPAFFPSTQGTRLIHVNFHVRFLKMVRLVGLDRAKPQRPRIHEWTA